MIFFSFFPYLDEAQLLDSGERGVRAAADDDCLLNLRLLRGLPSRS